jgi:beta-lactamase regulating signal transducer with metallopeptidase domain
MAHDLGTAVSILAGHGLLWLIQSSLLLGVGLLVGRLLRHSGPAVQSGVYRMTLIAILACPFVSASLSTAGVSGLPLSITSAVFWKASDPEPAIGSRLLSMDPLDAPGRRQAPAERLARNSETAAQSRGGASLASEVPVNLADASEIARPRGLREVGSMIFLSGWLLGSIALGLRLWIGQRWMSRLRTEAVPAGPEAAALCREIAERFRLIAPEVLRSPFLFSPCLQGIRRPAILLPEDDREDLRDTFIHEFAHLVRRDGLWNFLRGWAAVLLWFQPLSWVLSRRIEATAEEVCDDHVVNFGADRARYANRLVALAGRGLPPPSPAAVGMIALRSMLARRVVRILDTTRSPSTSAGRRAMAATLSLGFAGTLLAALLGVGRANEKAVEPPRSIDSDRQTAGVFADEGLESVAGSGEVPVTGRIIDLEGRPVAGVQLKVEEYRAPKGNDLSSWLKAVGEGAAPWIAADLIDWNAKQPEKAATSTVTDQDGRFRLEGLGRERSIVLSLSGESIAYMRIEVATRMMKPIPAHGFRNQCGPGAETIYGADFTYTAAPSRAVEGVVKDARTGTPLGGVEVRSTHFAGSDYVGIMALRTRSDGNGCFRLTGLPKGKNQLLLVPNDEQPYFLHEHDVPDPPGGGPVEVEIGLNRGIWLEGKLTEQGTGKPVPGARLFYLPFLENKFAQAIPEFGEDGNTHGTEYQDRYLTKADGSFRLVGLPGHALVGALALNKEYMAGAGSDSINGMNKSGHFETYRNPIPPGKLWPSVLKEISPEEGLSVVHVDLQVRSGDSVHVQVVDTQGNPLVGVRTLGITGKGSFDREPLKSADGVVTNLIKDEERTVAFSDETKKIGRVIRVHKGDDQKGPVKVTLLPLATITGRVLDAEGEPVAGALVRPGLHPGGDFSPDLRQVSTDKEGRFVVPNVPTGCEYGLSVEDMAPIRNRHFAYHSKVSVEPGKTVDAGEIRFKSD